MKKSLQSELDSLLSAQREKRSLLLHVCCAPCSAYVLEYLVRYFDITIYYYNPNLYPAEEFCKRYRTLEQLLQHLNPEGSVRILKAPYDPEPFLAAIQGLEQEPEGGRRCEVCFRLRLERAAVVAKELGCDYFTTTLSVGPRKDATLLDHIAVELAEAYGVPRLPSDFKKRGGYQRSVALSKGLGLYRQNYCGCIFSQAARKELENPFK